MIRRPPRSTLFPYDALPISNDLEYRLTSDIRSLTVPAKPAIGFGEITEPAAAQAQRSLDRKSTRLNSSHSQISYAVFCLKKKKKTNRLECPNLNSFADEVCR